MEKKIIVLTKHSDGYECLLCCEREATVKVKINRVKYDDNVIGFHVCDKCLSQMQDDIHKICEQQVFMFIKINEMWVYVYNIKHQEVFQCFGNYIG